MSYESHVVCEMKIAEYKSNYSVTRMPLRLIRLILKPDK